MFLPFGPVLACVFLYVLVRLSSFVFSVLQVKVYRDHRAQSRGMEALGKGPRRGAQGPEKEVARKGPRRIFRKKKDHIRS